VKRPRKAVVLAAGLGTRMGELSADLPKAMVPLWGKPAIGGVIDLLEDWGVRQVLVNLHHGPDPVFAYLRDIREPEISCSWEPKVLGTGGALKRAEWFIDEAPFWVVNADIAADVMPGPFLHAYEKIRPVAALWLDSARGPRTVEMKNGKITDFRSRHPGRPGTYTFCGLHLVSPGVVRFFPDEDVFSIIDAYEAALAQGRRIAGVIQNGSFWTDLGTPEQYLAAHRDVLRAYRERTPGARLMDPRSLRTARDLRARGVTVKGFAAIGRNAVVSPGATIRDSVVWDGASIGSAARLQGAIVCRNARVSKGAFGPVVRCDMLGEVPVAGEALRRLGWAEAGTAAIALGARGSARTFTRLERGARSVVLVQYDPAREENRHYASHARFLFREGLPVPRVLFDMPRSSAAVVEDLGDTTLEIACPELSSSKRERIYKEALDSLLLLHGIPRARLKRRAGRLQPAFSRKLYRWERELMATHFLEKPPRCGKKTTAGILRDLESVATVLLKAPHVLIHRDMQSSNIVLRKGKAVFIDFQGMRLGPAAYDLASLLCDPYVMLPERVQLRLLRYYASRCGEPEAITGFFWYAAVQRLAQAIGAYGRFTADPATAHFARHIPRALTMMKRALTHLDGLPDLSDFVSAQTSS